MNGRWMKMCSILLVLCMVFNMLPIVSNAAEPTAEERIVTPDLQEPIQAEPVLEAEEITANRTESTKTFRLNNGLYMAVVYPDAVHYETAEGWKEIDNTLVVQNGTYRNTAGIWEVNLPQQMTAGADISITKDGYTLSFRITGELKGNALSTASTCGETFAVSGVRNTTAVPQQIDLSAQWENAEFAEAVPDKLQSRLQYAEVFPNTDIIYDLDSNKVKESIVLETYDSTLQGYRYSLNTGGMIPVLEDSGRILFYDANQENVVMVMPAPYLLDANNRYNEDIQVTMTGSGSNYVLTYLLPQQWLAAEDRAWPVILDPVVTAQMNTSNIKDRTVAERVTYSAESGILECGYDRQYGIERIYLQYVGLPELNHSEHVVEAEIKMYKVGDSAVEVPVEVHKVNAAWDSNTITWANKPGYNSLVEDYTQVKNEDFYSWDVTNIVRGWYENGNTGMMFKAPDTMEQATTDNWKQFYSSDYSDYNGYKPTLYIAYRDNKGIEPYYSYQTMAAGHAGAAYVADSTGQLKVAMPIASYSSQINPFSLGLVYNSDYFAVSDSANDTIQATHGLDMYFGRGFTMDIIQTVKPANLENAYYNYLVYHDGDGTDHYFERQDDGTYQDEDGLGLTITVRGSDYIMTNDKGVSWTFEDGILSELADEYGNKIWIDWQESSAGRWFRTIYQQNKGKAAIPLVTLTYISGTSYIDTLTDAAGRVFRFSYDSDYRLIGIYQDNTHIAKYSYSGRRLIGMKDMTTGYQLWYEYTSGKINSIQEWTNTNYSGARMDVTYNPEQTIYQDYGNDRTKDTADDLWAYYSFDNAGRTVNACIKDSTGKVLGASTAELTETGSTENLRLNNRTLRTGSTGTVAQNLLDNGSFEENIVDFEGNFLNWSVSGTSAIANMERTNTTPHYGTCSLAGSILSESDLPLTASVTENLTAGTTYTFSGYINTAWVTSFGDSGIRLTVSDSTGTLWHSEYLNHSTADLPDQWERISVTFTPETSGDYQLAIEAVDIQGSFYLDDVQLEVGVVPSNYNLIPHGNMEGTHGWSTQGAIEIHHENDNEVLYMVGNPNTETCAWKNIPISKPGTQTYLLSGWAWANSVPNSGEIISGEASAPDTQKRFGLQARITYADGTYEYHYAPFCPDIHGWQYVSLTIVPKAPEKTVQTIQVVLAYEKNANSTWFDDISLVMEPAQTMRYDDEGNLISVTTTGLEENTASYENGNLIESQTGGSGKYTYEYNETYAHQLDSVNNGIIEQRYTYNEMGNVTGTSLQNMSGGKKLSTSAVYSDDGNLLISVTDATGNEVTYSYTDGLSKAFGLPTQVTDGKSQTSTTTYDSFGRVTNSALENIGNVGYTYNSDGTLSKISRNGTQDYLFTYDIWDRTTSISVGDTTLATYTYEDGNGNLLTQTYGNGDSVSYTYDDLGRIATVTYTSAAGTVIRVLTNTYNGNGQLYSVHDSATGQTMRYTYDSLGRLISASNEDTYENFTFNTYNQLTVYRYASQALGVGTQTYTYDTDDTNAISDGSLIQMVAVNGHSIGYQYDTLQRLNYKHINSGKTGGSMWERYTYADGKNANTTTTQVKEKKNWINDNVVSNDFFYEYDAVGNITKETRYNYAQAAGSQNVPGEETVYTYDTLNQLISATYENGRVETYTYDNAGNILTFNNGTASHTMTYGNAQWKDLLTAVDNQPITYDAIGNPLTYYDGSTMVWGEGRRLQSISKNGQTTSYLYDADGLRIQKTNPDGSYIKYHLMNGRYLGETHYNAQNVYQKDIRYTYDESENIIGIGIRNSATAPWIEYYFEKNLQGDIIAVYTAANGTNGLPELVASYSYDSWGNILSATGALSEINPFRYRGYYYDSETDFYYLQSRYYNPQIGRFLNADVLYSTGQGIIGNNMFAYCLNNPINFIDVSGRNAEALEWWSATMWWLPAADGPVPVGEILFFGGVAVFGFLSLFSDSHTTSQTPSYAPNSTVASVPIYTPPPTYYEPPPSTTSNINSQREEQFLIRAWQRTQVKSGSKEQKMHKHHIVAKNDWRAEESREILEAVGINPKNDPRNLVAVPEAFHQVMHTAAYHNYVTVCLRPVAGNRKGVEIVLVMLSVEIRVFSALGVRLG